MGRGITIILIAAIGAGYFLYQKFRAGNVGRVINEGRERLTNVLNRIVEMRSRNAADGNQRAVQPNPAVNRQAAPAAAPHVNRQPINRPPVPVSQANITETGPMVYFANDRHGRTDREFRFNYKKVGGSWRAYILRMPSLEGRADGSGTIHRLHDNGGDYICWDRPVNTLKDMQNVSRIWADCIQTYIATGRFERGQ